MARDRSLSVKLRADVSDYLAGMRSAGNGTREFAAKADASVSKHKAAFAEVGKTVASTGLAYLAGFGAMAKATDVLGDSIRAASDFQQTVLKAGVIFGKSLGDVQAWAAGAADSMGLSQRAAMEAAATFGDMFSQIGFGQDQARGMSQSVVQLAADLGSFNNLPTVDVLDRISAGFRGEYDSLQKLIPNISAARVEQQALATTGKASATQLSAQEKAAAVLAIVMKDGARAQGDFARSTGTYAIEQQKLNARYEDAKAVLGEKLLPVMARLTEVASGLLTSVTPLVRAFEAIPAPVQAAVATFVAFRLLHAPLTGAMQATVSRVRDLGEAFQYASLAADRAGGGLRGFQAGVSTFVGGTSAVKGAASGLLGVMGGPWGLAFTGAATVLGAWMQKQADARQRVADLSESLDRQTGAVTDNTRAIMARRLQDEGVFEDARKMGVAIEDVTSAALGQADALARVNTAIDAFTSTNLYDSAGEYARDLRGAIGGLSADTAEAVRKQQELTRAVGTTSTATTTATPPVKTFAQQLDEQKKASADAQKELDDLRQAVLDYGNTVAGQIDAEIGWQQAIADATEAVDRNGKTLDTSTAKGRDNMANLLDLAKAAKTSAVAMLDNKASIEQVNSAMTTSRAQFVTTATSMGYSTEKANALADQLGLTADNVGRLSTKLAHMPTATVIVETSEADRRVANLKSALDALNGKTYTSYVQAIQLKNSIAHGGSTYDPRLATGGYITGPGTGTSDSIPAMLSNGEYVVKAAAVDYYGVEKLHAINAMRFADGGLVGGNRTSVNASVSLPSDGWAITGSLNVGGQLVPLVDARIQQVIASEARAYRRGVR